MIIYINNTLAYLNQYDTKRLDKITRLGELKEVTKLLYLVIKDK